MLLRNQMDERDPHKIHPGDLERRAKVCVLAGLGMFCRISRSPIAKTSFHGLIHQRLTSSRQPSNIVRHDIDGKVIEQGFHAKMNKYL
jgi:hypothetical protein